MVAKAQQPDTLSGYSTPSTGSLSALKSIDTMSSPARPENAVSLIVDEHRLPGFPLSEGGVVVFDRTVYGDGEVCEEDWHRVLANRSATNVYGKTFALLVLHDLQLRLEGDQIVTDFVHPQEVRTLQKFNLSAGNGYIVPFRRIEFDMATATIDGHTYKMSILFEMLAGQHAKLGAHLGHSPGLKLMHLLAKEAKCFFYHYQLYLVHVDLIPISRPWRDLTFLERKPKVTNASSW